MEKWALIAFAAVVTLVFGGINLIRVSTLVRRTLVRIDEGKAAGCTLDHIDFGAQEIRIFFAEGVGLPVAITGGKAGRSVFARSDSNAFYAPMLLRSLPEKDFAWFRYTSADGFSCTYICKKDVLETMKRRVAKEALAPRRDDDMRR